MNSSKVAMFLFFFFFFFFSMHTTTSATALGANETDRLALLAFKSQIVHDPQGVLSSWNDSLHFCRWEGVICGHRHHERVSALDLPTGGLVGSLSPYIGNMSFLREIKLANNSFSGGIPPEIGRLFRLQVLRLYNNSLEGHIPANLSHCTNLTLLNLGGNKLVGEIPNSFSSLLRLKVLAIHFNNLSGGIPPIIGNLSSLESISFAYCHLGGSIPDVFHKLTSLRQLGLGINDLTVTVPSSIFNLSLLEILSFTQNKLEGIIPESLSLTLPHLQILELGDNHFSGTLPTSISNLSELQIFEVGLNDFYGKVAINFWNLHNLRKVFIGGNNLGSGEHDEMKFIDSLSNCSYLEQLIISINNFSGVLPDSLGNFSAQLRYLLLSANSLYGSLPSSIGHLSELTKLDLDTNQFSGTIPLTIGNLQNLQEMYPSQNAFFGKIPDSLGNLSLLHLLYIESNELEGTIPLSLGNCHNLNALSLYRNNLSGSIPKQIFGLSSLSIVLDLGNNHLSGPLPVEIGSQKNLGVFSVAENYLSGELPTSLGSCDSLELLDLSGNVFHGPIPTSFSSLRALKSLDLSRNDFSGVISEYLAEVPLQYLNISFNDFEGVVPVKGVFANSSTLSIVGNQKLCGGISELHLPKCNLKHSKSKLSVALIVVISIGSTLAGLAMVTLFLFYWCKKKRQDRPIGVLELKDSFFKISYEMLLKATNGFSSENLIGVGGFAYVYKGILNGDDDTPIVAVKVLNLQQRGSLKSFVTECEALRRVRHRNLVKVITCCSSVDFQGNDFKALVYQFMPNGSLEQWLHSSPTTSNEVQRLNLVQRIKIAVDVACAVEYLHHRSEIGIIHCDLKPSNILLDEDMVAHVGDFGLAKLLLPKISSPQASSTIRGTIGYAPPEYGLGNEASAEGDVYSYGILLFEMVTGKKPIDPLFQEGVNLHNYASMAIADRALEIVEPILLNQNNGECLISMLKIGVACSMESPRERMDISRVIHDLRLLLESINVSH